jgi:hypothetical protein
MRACLFRHVNSAEHAGNFIYTLLLAQRLDGSSRIFAVSQFRDSKLAVSLGRDLRQMRHAQHLGALTQLA